MLNADATKMRALTLHQPYASLMACGAKHIETRGHPAPRAVIGERVLLTAASTTAGIAALPGDCEGNEEDGWRYGYIGDYQASYCYRTGGSGKRGETELVGVGCEAEVVAGLLPMPLGVAVASGVLTACVPIVEHVGQAPHPRSDYVQGFDDRLWRCTPNLARHSGFMLAEDITGQRPYGDFAPGRWAYLFDDLARVEDRCPWCWGRGHIIGQDPNHPLDTNVALRCPVCLFQGRCKPFRLGGHHQGFWRWGPDDDPPGRMTAYIVTSGGDDGGVLIGTAPDFETAFALCAADIRSLRDDGFLYGNATDPLGECPPLVWEFRVHEAESMRGKVIVHVRRPGAGEPPQGIATYCIHEAP